MDRLQESGGTLAGYFIPHGIMLGVVRMKYVQTELVWQPTDIAGCVLWLRADSITGLDDGDPVGTWPDKSESNDFTQSIEAAKPLWQQAYFNGQDAVQFLGTDDTMVKTGGITVAQPFSVFMIIVDIDINFQSDHTFFRNSALTVTIDSIVGAGSELRLYAGASIASGTQDFIHNGDYIIEAQFNGASSLGFVNQVQKISGNPGAAGFNTNDLYLGSYGTGGWLIAHVLEVLLYDNNPSAGDRTALYSYFNTRYGL